jgi:YfiH family protein
MTRTRHVHLDISQDKDVAEIPVGEKNACPSADGLRAVLSLNSAGHMGRETEERRENRSRFLKRLRLDPDRVFGTTQIHSQTVLTVDRGAPPDYLRREADGLVTDKAEAILSVTAADCPPIFISAAGGRAWGLVHSGWKGTGLVLRAIELLQTRWGAARQDICVTIGPGIGLCCYAVGQDRYAEFTASFGPEGGRRRDGKYFLDLRAANVRLLEQQGIGSITVVDNCTHCEPLFGSFRRDGKAAFHNMLALFGHF